MNKNISVSWNNFPLSGHSKYINIEHPQESVITNNKLDATFSGLGT